MKISRHQVAVITGAGGGLGRSLAVQLAEKGCHLALVDIDQSALEATRNYLLFEDINISLHQADVGDVDAMRQLHSEVIEVHGAVNLLINNAGITLQKSFKKSFKKSFSSHSLDDWRRVMNVNLWGPLYSCKLFLESLKKEHQAHIFQKSR
ncbi:MAG: SDR family NAD(P)-dependent oxidoreductase [Endozoicomonas sp.]|uniref:SDR family NAD(P)-dependent oxidoreductase n=1 Tax=Endozoicomonas sp. TaxID=1892382 RepID=UPI003D9AC792